VTFDLRPCPATRNASSFTLPSPALAMLASAQIPAVPALEHSFSELQRKLAVYYFYVSAPARKERSPIQLPNSAPPDGNPLGARAAADVPPTAKPRAAPPELLPLQLNSWGSVRKNKRIFSIFHGFQSQTDNSHAREFHGERS
jgi:hypothetical protein